MSDKNQEIANEYFKKASNYLAKAMQEPGDNREPQPVKTYPTGRLEIGDKTYKNTGV